MRKGESVEDSSTVVLFTSEDRVVDKFQNNVYFQNDKQQTVALINERKVVNQRKAKPEEFVAFDELQRPTTMARKLF